MKRHLDVAVNVLSLVLIAMICVGLSKQYWSPPVAVGKVNILPEGAKVSLSGIDWKANKATLLMVLSTSCHFCSESAPFYRDLLSSPSKSTFHAVAVFPPTDINPESYIKRLALHIQDIRSAAFDAIGPIRGTPSLVLVDDTGRVSASWMGKLSSNQEAEVFRALGLTRQPQAVALSPLETSANSAAVHLDSITASDLRALMSHDSHIAIIDGRPRDRYRQGHISKSLSIPPDELRVRVPVEVSSGTTVVFYCDYCAECELKHGSVPNTSASCSIAAQRLQSLLIRHSISASPLRVLKEDLATLERSGIPIDRTIR